MPKTPIERILTCPNLPSLSAVAMQVLELAQDPNLSIARIAKAVQNDPALSTKVLRTVNSSFYALQTPCPNIGRAMSLLGLNTVKAIVLGFSLADCTKRVDGKSCGFDMEAFWRRAVYSAAAARALSLRTSAGDPDEAFVCALLQDIGMLAGVVALQPEYPAIVAAAPPDHDELPAIERRDLGMDHSMIGRTLADKWRLPPQIVDTIRFHHRIDDAPPARRTMLRTVALANLTAATLTLALSKAKLEGLHGRAGEWFSLGPAEVKDLIESTARGAHELAEMLEIKAGSPPDTAAILTQANEQIMVVQAAIAREAQDLKRDNEALARQTITDGLTGAHNRAYFDRESVAALERAAAARHPLSILFLDADRFKAVNDTHGHQAGDAVLMELARRLRQVGDRVGPFCRYGGEEFVLIAPGLDADKARKLAEVLRRVVCSQPFDLSSYNLPGLRLEVTVSVGAATRAPGTPTESWTAEQLTHAADQAVYAAKQAGRNCVRCAPCDGTPAPAQARRLILVVEDDPFAVRLLQRQLDKDKSLDAAFASTLAQARMLLSPGKPVPSLAFVDMHLPDGKGTELIRMIRAHAPAATIPVALVSGDTGEVVRLEGIRAGATCFVDKVDFIADCPAAIRSLTDQAAASRPAA
jgi:two-component system, cell cycle response regulator